MCVSFALKQLIFYSLGLQCGSHSPLGSEHSTVFSFWSCSSLWILLISDELQRPWSWGTIQLLSPRTWSFGVSRIAKESSPVFSGGFGVLAFIPSRITSGKKHREGISKPLKWPRRGERAKIGKGSGKRDGCALCYCLPRWDSADQWSPLWIWTLRLILGPKWAPFPRALLANMHVVLC